jgi:hypothetical protein
MKTKITVLAVAVMGIMQLSAQEQPPKPPSAEERLQRITTELNKNIKLSTAQQAKVQAAYKDFFADMDKLRAAGGDKNPPPPPPPPPGKKEDVDKLVKARDAKIKAALSEAQYKTYTEVEMKMRPPRPGDKPGKQGPPPPAKQ